MKYKPHYYQTDAKNAIFNYYETGGKGNPLVCMPTGCHAKDTEILMFDGSIKLVQNVEIGDLLMGPDSNPRWVLNLARGREVMYEITPIKGESFVVNENHILSLMTTQEKSVANYVQGRLLKGDIENITVKEYLNKSKWYKHTRKLYRAAVDFKVKSDWIIEPYSFGCLLGDGSFVNSPNLTTMDNEIAEIAYSLAEQFGLKVLINTKPNNLASSYMITGRRKVENLLTKEFERLEVKGLTSEFKFIPDCYKLADYETRIHVLAGLIDTDGSLSCNTFDYVSKSKRLAKDVQFVARSVGLSANVRPCQKGCQTGAIGTYYRVCISGETSIIPTRLKRKQAHESKQKKNPLVTGFTLKELPKDDFYGFSLDKDHLYLTGDFMVHHNTGKSIVIADFLHTVFNLYPNQRVMMLTHVWKLILQNAEKMQNFWPTAPIGIHSAQLKMRDTMMPIIFGGVQSVVKTIEKSEKEELDIEPILRHFGHRDLLLIDEAHLLGTDEDSSYLKVIAALSKINPFLKVIGFTATPYRMKMGTLLDGGLFSDIAYDITTHEWFKRLIAEGYLSKLIGKPTNTKIAGIENVSIKAGEFDQGQAEALIDTDEVTYSAVKEILDIGYNRNKCMVFAAGIKNAEHIAAMMQSFGANVACVHSELSTAENKKRLDAYDKDDLWGIVGANMLTTGYDNPRIDLIADMQMTRSPGKHVQKLGRGTRVYPSKDNCLVLDFVGNIGRNGPVDDPVMPRKPGQKTGDVPIKICTTDKLIDATGCDAYNHASTRNCCNCAAEFHFKNKVQGESFNDSPMKQEKEPIIEMVELNKNVPVFYSKHSGKDRGNGIISPPTVKVVYPLGLRPVNVFLCFEHTGMPRHKAHEWWRKHSPNEPPKTVDEFMTRHHELREPKAVMVHSNTKFPDILSYEF